MAIKDFKKGDQVKIKLEGKEIEATVILASGNGKSLAVEFDGFVGGYVMMMPILYHEDLKEYVDLVQGRVITIVQ